MRKLPLRVAMRCDDSAPGTKNDGRKGRKGRKPLLDPPPPGELAGKAGGVAEIAGIAACDGKCPRRRQRGKASQGGKGSASWLLSVLSS